MMRPSIITMLYSTLSLQEVDENLKTSLQLTPLTEWIRQTMIKA